MKQKTIKTIVNICFFVGILAVIGGVQGNTTEHLIALYLGVGLSALATFGNLWIWIKSRR